MTKIDLAKQQQKLEQLKSELNELNKRFDENKEKLGLAKDAEISVDDIKMTPELQEAMEKIKAEAKRAAQNAVANMKDETEVASAAVPTGHRRGALSI